MDVYIYYAVTTVHYIVCAFMILVILLQTGKGADMGAAFGGGSSNTVFGGRGPANFLHYLTYGCAATFLATSLYLAIVRDNPAGAESAYGVAEEAEEAGVGSAGEENKGAAATDESKEDEQSEQATGDEAAKPADASNDAAKPADAKPASDAKPAEPAKN